MKPVKLRPLPLLAWGGAWVCLSGLALVRLWALLYGRLPSLAIPALAALLTGAVLLAARRLDVPGRFLLPFGPTWKTGLLAAAAFVVGAAVAGLAGSLFLGRYGAATAYFLYGALGMLWLLWRGDAQRPDKLLLLEKWTTREAQKVHMGQPHMALIQEVKERCAAGMTLETYDLP